MIVADHSKFGRLALARLCGLEEVDDVVVHSGLTVEDRAILQDAGVTIHVAPIAENRANGSIAEPSRSDGVRSDE
jgi:hypothetical protein